MKVGQYEVVRALGQGGMAKILLAKDQQGQDVVLKVPLKKDPEQLERLRDEARIGMRLRHPSVVDTLALLDQGTRPILVVEYVRGASLSQLRRLGPLPASVVVRVGRQIAEGLAALHEANDEQGKSLGILHRDVTGGNILLNSHGDAKLIDLGIARSEVSQAKKTRLGVVRGTLRYLAPELLLGGSHDESTDLWSLGVTLWEALLGRRALEGDQAEVMQKIRDLDVMTYQGDEQVDPRLHDAIAALLAPKEQRLQKARAVSNIFARLENAFGNGQTEASKAVSTVLDALAPTESRPLSDKTQDLIRMVWPFPDTSGFATGFDEETVQATPKVGRDAVRTDEAPTKEGDVDVPTAALPSDSKRAKDAALDDDNAAATIQMAAFEYPDEVRAALADGKPGVVPGLASEEDTVPLQKKPHLADVDGPVSAETEATPVSPGGAAAPAPISSLGTPVVSAEPAAKKTQALYGDVLQRALADAPGEPADGSPAAVDGHAAAPVETPNEPAAAAPVDDKPVAAEAASAEPSAPTASSDVGVVPGATDDDEPATEVDAAPVHSNVDGALAAAADNAPSAETAAAEESASTPAADAPASSDAAEPPPEMDTSDALDASPAPSPELDTTERIERPQRPAAVNDDDDDDIEWKPKRTGLYAVAGVVVLVFVLGLGYAIIDVVLSKVNAPDAPPPTAAADAGSQKTAPAAADAGVQAAPADPPPTNAKTTKAKTTKKKRKKKKRRKGKRRRRRRSAG